MTSDLLQLDTGRPRAHPLAHYTLGTARDSADVEAAQRLRHLVFATEGGARTPGPDGLDCDEFDDLCDHLLVWHTDKRTGDRQVIATYRLLPPHANDAHPRSAGLYSATEFDLRALEPILDDSVEAGRACVHPAHRGGAAPMSLLWQGIARYLELTGYRYIFGCASIDVGREPRLDTAAAAAFTGLALRTHAAPPRLWCQPRRPLPLQGGVDGGGRLSIPPLLRGYLRLGAQVCGGPAHDPDFGSADFLVLLDRERIDQRYLRFFLGGSAGGGSR